MKRLVLSAIFLLLLWVVAPCMAGTVYVDSDATGANDGTSWADAFNWLQDALASASSGDQILVAEGIYKPDQGVGVTPGDRDATFQLVNSVAIYGGFAGDETGLEERDWETNETILSGDLADNDGPDFANNGENSYHVVTGSGTNETAILEGFTIMGGNANGEGGPVYQDYGAGMYNAPGNPTVSNCIFRGNSAKSAGGGMFNRYSSPMVKNCMFSGNSAVGYAGGMGNYYSSPKVVNCIFSGNSSREAGGINGDSGKPTITNCTFSGNYATYSGGGLHNFACSPDVTNCIFWGNTSPIGAQIYEMAGSSANVTYSAVQDGWPGGNINEDPCFADPANDDYHLLPDSPCIDAGDNASVPPEITTDLDGNPRIVNGIVDMGALEAGLLDPVDLLLQLAQDVIDLNLQQGISNSLDAKLGAAMQALDDINENNDVAAINTLEAFINAVEAQRGNKIPEADADALIAKVQEIIDLLSAE